MIKTDEKPTLNDLKKMKGFTVAQTLSLQSKIFNCSLEVAWDHHIHKGIHRANNKDEIICLAKQILHHEKMDAHKKVKRPSVFMEGYQTKFNSIYIDKESTVLVKYTLVNAGRYKLEVFRDNQIIYTHKTLLTYPFSQTSLILRQKLRIKRMNFNWEIFKEELNE